MLVTFIGRSREVSFLSSDMSGTFACLCHCFLANLFWKFLKGSLVIPPNFCFLPRVWTTPATVVLLIRGNINLEPWCVAEKDASRLQTKIRLSLCILSTETRVCVLIQRTWEIRKRNFEVIPRFIRKTREGGRVVCLFAEFLRSRQFRGCFEA